MSSPVDPGGREPTARAHRLILFDVDGTLLDCCGQTRSPLAEAMRDVFGTAGGIDGYDFSGKTDPQIVTEIQVAAGTDPARVAAALPAVRDAYVERLETGLRRDRMRLLPGAAELLRDLGARAGTVVGLLTGNWEAGGRIKLGRFALNRYFELGAFGDGRLDRRELPPVALARAREVAGRTFAPAETLIVGDSRLDVECGHAHGIEVLAVSSGWTSAADLAAAGADWVYDDLAAARAHATLAG